VKKNRSEPFNPSAKVIDQRMKKNKEKEEIRIKERKDNYVGVSNM